MILLRLAFAVIRIVFSVTNTPLIYILNSRSHCQERLAALAA